MLHTSSYYLLFINAAGNAHCNAPISRLLCARLCPVSLLMTFFVLVCQSVEVEVELKWRVPPSELVIEKRIDPLSELNSTPLQLNHSLRSPAIVLWNPFALCPRFPHDTPSGELGGAARGLKRQQSRPLRHNNSMRSCNFNFTFTCACDTNPS